MQQTDLSIFKSKYESLKKREYRNARLQWKEVAKIVLPSCDVYKPQQQTAWHHGGNLVGYCLTDNNY